MTNFLNKNKIYIIAEIGVNHNNNLVIAKKLIIEAKKAGADAVKFQTFSAQNLVIPGTRKVKYQKQGSSDKETHYEMIKKLELSLNHHKKLFKFCKKKKITFLSTPYDVKSAKFLKALGVKIYKTASADLTDIDLQTYLAKTKKNVIISTGMSTISEIQETLKIYQKYKNKNYALLHCVSNYPCKHESINLSAMNLLKENFKCQVGYSDHSSGNLAACLSVAFGAKIIEKHFTLNKKMKGPDHKASCTPSELKSYINDIRLSEIILGKKIKNIQKEELEMSRISKKSLYFKKDFLKGKVLRADDLIALRPAKGISPMKKFKLIGITLKKNVKENDLVKFNLLK